MSEPASIRTNNPGAMWGGNAISKKWGETGNLELHDGLGQGNHAAIFPTKVDGACAQFDLWRSRYAGLTLGAAITKWSGGNSSPSYMAFLTDRTCIKSSDLVTQTLLAGPKGLALMKAQAQWEAGKPYPMTDAEWQEAQARVFRGAIPPPPDIPKPELAPVIPAPQRSLWGFLVSIFKGNRNA